ncbi:putative C-terminal domain small phosphatase [Gossypium australe]|uniref:Mitochondrial import inner membrane translocase subunit TIM50 n=1 Tax=Gossypium australe TaxID=47621 RepID=A0A5B6W2W1_9ROSI|nr:putative C-terminal domain small phosphatase [Gossypium australe]
MEKQQPASSNHGGKCQTDKLSEEIVLAKSGLVNSISTLTLLDERNSEESSDSIFANETSDVSLTIVRTPVSQLRKKLLVLDVNGLLADIIYRPPKNYKADAHIAGRAKKQTIDCLFFLWLNIDILPLIAGSIMFHRRNLERVVDFLMGDMKQKLLFCWDSSHCTTTQFKSPGHRYKPLVFKELRKLWRKSDPNLPWEKGYYNESNTLLIDDSPYKALLNPLDTAIFPHPFKFDMDDDSLGVGGELRVYLERLALAENIQKFLELNPFGQIAITERSHDWGFYSQVIDTCVHSQLQQLNI